MSDQRNFNWWRLQRWGERALTLCELTGDADYTEIFQVDDDFDVVESKDEESGRMIFEFRIFEPDCYDKDQMEAADLWLFAGRKIERKSFELKRNDPAHWKLVGVPIGEYDE